MGRDQRITTGTSAREIKIRRLKNGKKGEKQEFGAESRNRDGFRRILGAGTSKMSGVHDGMEREQQQIGAEGGKCDGFQRIVTDVDGFRSKTSGFWPKSEGHIGFSGMK